MDKAKWRAYLDRWDSCRRLGLYPTMPDSIIASLTAHSDVIRKWVYGGCQIEMRIGSDVPWGKVQSTFMHFSPNLEYRVGGSINIINTTGLGITITRTAEAQKITPELTMEQYSKEFWQQCLNMHPMHLSNAIAWAINKHKAHIEAWVDGARPEVYGDSGWVSVPKDHHQFTHQNKYRAAPPKTQEWDIVVYWRDAMEVGGRRSQGFTMPAAVDVARLPVNPASPVAPTLAKLQAKTPGFKLLSITRVVVDDNHNLTEYSTKLDNLGRVPF